MGCMSNEDQSARCAGPGAVAFDEGISSGSLKLTLGAVDLPRIERAVKEILAAVGEDPNREGLLETPARVARMYAEMFAGLKVDPRLHLKKVFTEQYDEVVLVLAMSICSMCE